MLFIFDNRVCKRKLQDEFERLCTFRRAELANSVEVAETFQPIPTGFHIELVRARSQPANYFADAGLLVEVKEKPGKWNGTVNGGTVSRVLAVFSCS